MKREFGKKLVLVIFIFIIVPAQILAEDFIAKKPPESLDKFYPPISPESRYTMKMIDMGNHYSGIFVDIEQDDWENAEKHANKLVDDYSDSAKMVPEWKDYFKPAAVKALAEMVKTRDKKQIKKAADPVAETCHKCHLENRVSVWTRYHWPLFKNINMVDPISEKEVGYEEYMWDLSFVYNSIIIDFEEGQYKYARKALKNFKYKYMELKSTCPKCHVDNIVKKLFVGKSIDDALKNIKTELKASVPDKEIFKKNIEIIRKEGCKMCHLTHFSATMIKHLWKHKE